MPTSPIQKTRLFLLTLAHFCVDSYATLLAPVLPLVTQRLDLSYAQAGVLGTIVSICNISQPLMGLWADRMARRYLVISGLLLAAVCSPMLGIAPSYTVLIAVLALSGIGVAAFHPQVFSLAGELSGQRRSFGLALFIFGGTMGLGLTPLWMPYFAHQYGLSRLPVIIFPGLVAALLLVKFIPLDNPQLQHRHSGSLLKGLSGATFALTIITLVVILRSVTGLGFGYYLTLLAQERGLTLVAGGALLGIYNISGVVGALIAGYLADHFNAKPLVWGSLLLSMPALYGFVKMGGPGAYVLLAVGGGLLLASNSIMVAMAQDLAPQSSGLASSLPLGFSWGLASLTLGPIGYLADRIGMIATLEYLTLLPLLPALLALLLPGVKKENNNDG